MSSFVYPVYVIQCKKCGFVGSILENVGTETPYIKYCPSCGEKHVKYKEATNKEQHEKLANLEIGYNGDHSPS